MALVSVMSCMTSEQRAILFSRAAALVESLPAIAAVMEQAGNSEEYWQPVLEASYTISLFREELERTWEPVKV